MTTIINVLQMHFISNFFLDNSIGQLSITLSTLTTFVGVFRALIKLRTAALESKHPTGMIISLLSEFGTNTVRIRLESIKTLDKQNRAFTISLASLSIILADSTWFRRLKIFRNGFN